MKSKYKKSVEIIAITLALTSYLPLADSCTRALYVGADNTVITGRTMDWNEDMRTDLWVLPAGMARNGLAGPQSPSWISKYGSVVASVYGIASADGMNEKGLVMNLLYLAESDYGQVHRQGPRERRCRLVCGGSMPWIILQRSRKRFWQWKLNRSF